MYLKEGRKEGVGNGFFGGKHKESRPSSHLHKNILGHNISTILSRPMTIRPKATD